MRHVFHNQRGSERTYAIVGFTVIILLIFLGWKFAGPFFKNMDLNTYTQKLVNYDYLNERPTPNGVRSIHKKLAAHVLKKGMPIDKKQIKVEYDLAKYYVDIEYTQVINLYVAKIQWDCTIDKESDNTR